MWDGTIEVVKDVRTTKRRRIPFLSMRRRSTRSMWLNMLWWLSHMTRIVMKLVTKAKKNGASLIRPSVNDGASVDGSWRFRTSNVIAKAKTPSLNASVLAVSFAPRLSPFSMGRTRRHASGRFEGAAVQDPTGSKSFESSVHVSFHGRFAVTSRPRGEVFLPFQVKIGTAHV